MTQKTSSFLQELKKQKKKKRLGGLFWLCLCKIKKNVETTAYYEAIHHQLFFLSLSLKVTQVPMMQKWAILDFTQCNFSDLLALLLLLKSYLKLDAVVQSGFSLLTKKTGQSAKDRKHYKYRLSVFTDSEDEINHSSTVSFKARIWT